MCDMWSPEVTFSKGGTYQAQRGALTHSESDDITNISHNYMGTRHISFLELATDVKESCPIHGGPADLKDLLFSHSAVRKLRNRCTKTSESAASSGAGNR